MSAKRILIIDDDPAFNAMLTGFLKRNDYATESAHSAKSAVTALGTHTFDLVLTDFKLPDMDGLELIRKIKADTPTLPVILITNYADIRTAVNSIKLGAYEFVSKPVIPDELLILVKKALDKNNKAVPAQEKVPASPATEYIVGSHPSAVALWKHIEMVAPTNMSVLITGESGTGKERVARLIRDKSKRKDEPFVAIDCGALGKDLAASELFGHVKGAFTGALHDKKGQFELANKGTLFLDEIGNLPYDVQVMLLRAIQERTVRRVGSDREMKVDVRIMAATNESLQHAIEKGAFRHDLYHRLNEFELRIPPLRERLDDLAEYARYFIREANAELGRSVTEISPEAMAILRNYTWPGNLRELRNIVKRATLLCMSDVIAPEHLPEGLGTSEPHAIVPNTTDLKQLQEAQEKAMIVKVLQDTRYNKSKAARMLNIDRTTLYAKIKQYGIDA